MGSPRQRGRGALIAVAAVALLGCAAAVVSASRTTPNDAARDALAPPEERGAPRDVAPPAPGEAAAVAAPLAERDDPGGEPPSVDRVAALRRALASADVAERINAIEAAVSASAVEALDELARFDLPGDPEAAPTAIHAVASLGASAGGAKRDEAARTLATWLRQELGREGADALGNTSNLVEALGDVGGREAVAALTAALDRQELPLHMETLAVMKLGALRDPAARGAVERFAARVAGLPPSDGLEEELRVEAIEAARATLANI